MLTLDSRSRGGLRKVARARGDEDEEEQSIDWGRRRIEYRLGEEKRRAVAGRE